MTKTRRIGRVVFCFSSQPAKMYPKHARLQARIFGWRLTAPGVKPPSWGRRLWLYLPTGWPSCLVEFVVDRRVVDGSPTRVRFTGFEIR